MKTLRKSHINGETCHVGVLKIVNTGCPKDSQYSPNLSADLVKMQLKSEANEFSRNKAR